MSAKKGVKRSASQMEMSKNQWKENPPGPHQKALDRLFLNGEIHESDTPNNIKKKYPIFNEFSSQVFGAHFRKTKAKYGYMLCAVANQPGSVAKKIAGNIEELGEMEIPDGDATTNEKNIDYENDVELEDKIEYTTPPYLAWYYDDHEIKCKKIYVAVVILSGVKDIEFEISGDGRSVTIHYAWPSCFYKPLKLFAAELTALINPISANHPKIHSLQTKLFADGITDKCVPKGQIKIKLPMAVQREYGTWSKQALITEDDTKVALLEMKSFQDDLHIKDIDTKLHFD